MRTKEEIQAKIEKIKADNRMKNYGTPEYKPANVQVNAPLALIQCTYEGMIAGLEYALNEATDSNNGS